MPRPPSRSPSSRIRARAARLISGPAQRLGILHGPIRRRESPREVASEQAPKALPPRHSVGIAHTEQSGVISMQRESPSSPLVLRVSWHTGHHGRGALMPDVRSPHTRGKEPCGHVRSKQSGSGPTHPPRAKGRRDRDDGQPRCAPILDQIRPHTAKSIGGEPIDVGTGERDERARLKRRVRVWNATRFRLIRSLSKRVDPSLAGLIDEGRST